MAVTPAAARSRDPLRLRLQRLRDRSGPSLRSTRVGPGATGA